MLQITRPPEFAHTPNVLGDRRLREAVRGERLL